MRILLLFMLISTAGLAQPRIAASTQADLSFLINALKLTDNQPSEALRKKYPIHTINGIDYISVIGKTAPDYNPDNLKQNGVLVGSKIKDILSVKYPLSALGALTNEPNFSFLELAPMVQPHLDRVPKDVRADSVWGGYGLPQGYTGKDVIIGITDWGFDYTSPMFYDTLLSNTRILAAWDQWKNSGPNPAGYSYGTEYNTPTDLINAGSDTANLYSYATHGSHVAGIAGGSGAGTEYRGIAFEANYLFATFHLDLGSVLDAWQWMYDKATAEGKRLVVNMSWGLYHLEAIDGTSLGSQALDNYSDLGVTFVTSAGNNGNVDFHIKKDYSGTDTLLTRINFYSAPLSTLWGQSVSMWGDTGGEFSAQLRMLNSSNQVVAESPFYSSASFLTTYIDSFVVASATTDTLWFNLAIDQAYPTNVRPHMRLRVKIPPSGYRAVLASTAPNGTVHYWNLVELTNDAGNWGMPFSTLGTGYTAGDDLYGIGTPACSQSAITIAAHSAEYQIPGGSIIGGGPSTFSSKGPLMTDSLKPDVSAPGVNVCSSISSFTDQTVSVITSVNFMGRTYPFAKFSGTSMSSPATAGVAALILDANPYLMPWQVKEILNTTARHDVFTAPPHDLMWGWGKVDAYAAVQLALVTTGLAEIPKEIEWKVYPNPASDVLHIDGLKGSIQSIQIIDMQGRSQEVDPHTSTIELTGIAPGTYYLRVVHEYKVEQQKFVIQ